MKTSLPARLREFNDERSSVWSCHPREIGCRQKNKLPRHWLRASGQSPPKLLVRRSCVTRTNASGRSGGLAFPERPHRQKRSWRARGIMPAVWLPMLPPPFCYSAQSRSGLRPGTTGSSRRGGQFDRRLTGNSASALEVLWATNTAREPEHLVQPSSWHHQVSRSAAISGRSGDVSIPNYKVNGIIHTNVMYHRIDYERFVSAGQRPTILPMRTTSAGSN